MSSTRTGLVVPPALSGDYGAEGLATTAPSSPTGSLPRFWLGSLRRRKPAAVHRVGRPRLHRLCKAVVTRRQSSTGATRTAELQHPSSVRCSGCFLSTLRASLACTLCWQKPSVRRRSKARHRSRLSRSSSSQRSRCKRCSSPRSILAKSGSGEATYCPSCCPWDSGPPC
jgi:hypothetical protein